MKVLIYSPLAVLSYHFETDLELIKKHQDAGDEVFVIGCNGDLKSVGYFGCQGFLRCASCKSRWNEGMDILSLPEENRSTVELKNKKQEWIYDSKKLF